MAATSFVVAIATFPSIAAKIAVFEFDVTSVHPP
jgi:hypothetical protein